MTKNSSFHETFNEKLCGRLDTENATNRSGVLACTAMLEMVRPLPERLKIIELPTARTRHVLVQIGKPLYGHPGQVRSISPTLSYILELW